MTCTLDRITAEHGIVLMDNGLAFTLPRSVIDALQAREGDILEISVNHAETGTMRNNAATKLSALFARTANKQAAQNSEDTAQS